MRNVLSIMAVLGGWSSRESTTARPSPRAAAVVVADMAPHMAVAATAASATTASATAVVTAATVTAATATAATATAMAMVGTTTRRMRTATRATATRATATPATVARPAAIRPTVARRAATRLPLARPATAQAIRAATKTLPEHAPCLPVVSGTGLGRAAFFLVTRLGRGSSSRSAGFSPPSRRGAEDARGGVFLRESRMGL